jgi:Zn-dependent M16 (insulinase) family peptidase
MKYSVGDQMEGFQIIRSSRIEEVNADAYLMEHSRSGARLLYLDSPDDNKVFYICFRTPPDNSKGTPHIMEHSTLCGSRKFPLKEPFVELAKGSLNTFLNAITWPDKTMYPVASRNEADFRNLMDVYLDAVFFPNCLKDPQILMQEGWHYEMDGKDGPLTYNGVVYNEMKGALSSPDALLDDTAMKALFPDTTYGVESGGDPEVIPSLTFKEFTDFHRRFYHPSNSYIYLYGNMDIRETLKEINGSYLSLFDRHDVDSHIRTQSAFEQRRLTEGTYGIAAGENEKGKAVHALYTAFTDHVSTAEALGFRILNYTLVEMEGAPLKKAVIDAGLGTDLSGSYSDSYKQPVWSLEVTGSEPDRGEDFGRTVDGALRSLALNGIDRDMLEAALNRTEFILRESDYQGRPKGLFYGVRVMDLWLYDKDPFDALRYEEDLAFIRSHMKDGFFENLLIRYFLKNTHQVLATMRAEKGLTEKKNTETAEKLATFKHSLSPEQIDRIIEDTKALKKRQSEPDTAEHLETIPLLSREDLKRKIEEDPMEEEKADGISFLHYKTDTSGIAYVSLYFTLYGLEAEDLCYAHLLTDLLGAMDTEKRSYQDIARLSNACTGGMSFGVSGYSRKDDDSQYVPVMTVRGKALTAQTAQLMDLLGDVMLHTSFADIGRLKELLQEEKSDWDMTTFGRGHTLVMHRLLSYFSPVEKFREQGDLTYYYFLAGLVRNFDSIHEQLAERLQAVMKKIFTRSSLTLQVIGQEAEKEAVKGRLDSLTSDMPEGVPCSTLAFDFPESGINEGIMTSGKVQYVAKGGNFRRNGFTYTGALQVMETILRYEYLWKKVRIQGGAYGAFTQFGMNGNSLICSYRDPNLAETLHIYEELPDYLRDFHISDREMTKYVIGTMAQAEIQYTPVMKGERAMMFRFTGMTKEDRIRTRREIIQCTDGDIRALAPLVESIMKEPYFCVMGSEDRIRGDEKLFDRVISLPE